MPETAPSLVLTLLQDPLFMAAFLIFLATLAVPVYCIRAYKNGQRADNNIPPEDFMVDPSEPFNEPARPGVIEPSAFQTARAPEPRPGPAAFENETSVMYSMMEERFGELAKRIASLETFGGKPAAGAAAAPPDALLKRLATLEEEIRQLKSTLAGAPGPQDRNFPDLSKLTAKVDMLQRILEDLTTETETAKPT
jgi:hypothetical protein